MNLFSEQIEMQNGCEDTMEEGEGGMNWESSTDICTIMCKIDDWWEAVPHRELSSVLCDDPDGWDRGRGEWGSEGGGDIHIFIADSCCCTAETNTTVKQLSSN